MGFFIIWEKLGKYDKQIILALLSEKVIIRIFRWITFEKYWIFSSNPSAEIPVLMSLGCIKAY